MLLLKRSLVEACSAAGRAADPNEFLGLLEGERTKIEGEDSLLLTRIIVPPGLSVDGWSAGYLPWMLPSSISEWGTFHSHPSGSARPSGADLALASKEGGIHLLICRPYTPDKLIAYGGNGKRIQFKIVP